MRGRRVDLAGLKAFVMQRLRKDGGFAATPLQPHTIQDTFCAVSILRCLTGPDRRDPVLSLAAGATGRYLADYADRHPEMPARTAFQLLRLARYLGLSLRLRWRPAGRGDKTDYEERWYRAILSGEIPTAGSGFTSPRWTVKQLCHYLRLQRLSEPGQPPAEAEEMVRWLRRCQAPDGGFGFFPHTTSYIENCHWALAALALLDSRPGRPESAAAFILSCQTASGGFSRNSRAAPFLDSSWHAVQALRHLAHCSGSQK
ncbi:prenyltransferase/squalene oxidase repeat-containing protein [Thermodesulfobacteriota bacterium B35]